MIMILEKRPNTCKTTGECHLAFKPRVLGLQRASLGTDSPMGHSRILFLKLHFDGNEIYKIR